MTKIHLPIYFLFTFLFISNTYTQSQNYLLKTPLNDLNQRVNYIEKFDSWKSFLDSFNNRDELINFFGKENIRKKNMYGSLYKTREELEDEEKKHILQGKEFYFDFNSKTFYSPATIREQGSVKLNPYSNQLNYNSTTTATESTFSRKTYWIRFEFSDGGRKQWLHDWDYSDEITRITVSENLKTLNDREFIRMIKKFYNTIAVENKDKNSYSKLDF